MQVAESNHGLRYYHYPFNFVVGNFWTLYYERCDGIRISQSDIMSGKIFYMMIRHFVNCDSGDGSKLNS